MRMTSLLIGAVFLVADPGTGTGAAAGEAPTPEQVLAGSIAHHDPNGFWNRGEIRLQVRTLYSEAYAERAGASESQGEIVLCPAEQEFRYTRTRGGDVIEYRLNGGEGGVTLNGSADISEEDRERLRIGKPAMYRDYFEYLYGMPMKLRDPGTRLDPEVAETEFSGQTCWAIRVTYDPEVGEDIWYFYFDRASFALIGYRFFHDESVNDGEYITFEGEAEDKATGLRLPRARAWYFNADDAHLATDDIVLMSTRTPEPSGLGPIRRFQPGARRRAGAAPAVRGNGTRPSPLAAHSGRDRNRLRPGRTGPIRRWRCPRAG